jgi:hypothetical protein
VKHGGEGGVRTIDRASETRKEPFHPERHVQRALVRLLKHVVVLGALLADLRRHAVEALRAVLRARQREIGNRTGGAPIAIVQGVDRHEPEITESGLQHVIDIRVAAVIVEPVEKRLHFSIEPIGGGGLEVDAVTSDRSGNDLHSPRAVIAPRAHA